MSDAKQTTSGQGPLLSILIPTLESRRHLFQRITEELNRQISAGGYERKVQICSLCDNRQATIGEKRNRLLEMATGEYVAFVDDDDQVSTDYVNAIIRGIEAKHPDVIGIVGMLNIVSEQGVKHRNRFYHTIRNNKYFTSNRGYERPPNHLNPMKREIAIKYKFPEANFGEDKDWAMQIATAGELKSEFYIDYPLYFYDYFPLKQY